MYCKDIIDILSKEQIEYVENMPLAPYTSFRIGGAARLAVFPKSRLQVIAVFDVLRESKVPYLIMGNGSNLLVSDKGFSGVVVILTSMRNCTISGTSLYAEAGASITAVASEASKKSLTGLEFAYGIPGTVGGGVFMNAGAYDGEFSNVICASEYYDLTTGKLGILNSEEHKFAYRYSTYMEGGKVILGAEFKLFEGKGSEIEAKMQDFLSRRREKQPLEYPSAGSVFKRGKGFFTAKLIDEAGLKGKQIGGAQVSEKHAGFIVNKGGATSEDVLELIDIIKNELKDRFSVDIECEIRYING